jgi:hypothetical protein
VLKAGQTCSLQQDEDFFIEERKSVRRFKEGTEVVVLSVFTESKRNYADVKIENYMFKVSFNELSDMVLFI